MPVVQMPLGIQPPPQLPRRLGALGDEHFPVSRPSTAGLADGVSEALPDRMVSEVATFAELVVTDPEGVNVPGTDKARCLFRCISQR